MPKYKNAILGIWIKGHFTEQGKFWAEGKKTFYLQNISDNKWVRMVGGYAIAEQILEAFSKAKVKPKIIFSCKEKGYAYSTTQTELNKHGMPYPYGSHRQRAMSVKWMKLEKDFNEPYELPVMDISVWIKGDNTTEIFDNGKWITI